MSKIPRRPKPTQILPQYDITTSSVDYQSWPWYQDYLREVEEHKEEVRTKGQSVLSGGLPVPLSAARGYCVWLLETPEIRDVICRRFILGDYDNDLESRLLSNSVFHYLAMSHYPLGGVTALGDCWHIAKEIMAGILPSLNDPLVDEMLLSIPVLIVRD